MQDTIQIDEFSQTIKLLDELTDLRYEMLQLKMDNKYLELKLKFYEKFYVSKEKYN